MEPEEAHGSALVTLGRRREAPWFQLFHEIVDLYGPRCGGFAGIGYWVALRRYVNREETNPWRGHAFPTVRHLCALGGVGPARIQQMRDLCVTWGLLDVSIARQVRFVGGQAVGETRRLLYRVNDPLTAGEFAAAVASGALPRPVEPPQPEEIPEHGAPGPGEGEGGTFLDRNVPEPQGVEGTFPDRNVGAFPHGNVRTFLDGALNRKNQEQIQKTAAEPAEPPEHGREDPPAAAAAGGGEAPGAAAAAPPAAAALCPARTESPQPEPAGVPDRAVGGEDLGAVCLRYTDLTGRVDLTPEQVREAAGEATTDTGYLERTLDWLRRRVAEGTVHSPRGLFLHALRHRWADQTPPPDGPGSGGRRPAEGPRDPVPAGPSPVAAGPPAGAPDLRARLVEAGVREPVAADLARWDAAECERQLRWLPYRGAQNPGATLLRATRERWGAPAADSAAKAPGERCPAPEERRAEQEREQTRKLFVEMAEAERAAREPGAEARGRAAIAEIWAMLARKNGGAASARRRVGAAVPASPEPAGDGEGGRLRALPLSGLLETAAALRPGGPAAPAGGGERQRCAGDRAPSPGAWRRKGTAAQASGGARDAEPRTVAGHERDGPGRPLLRGCG